MNEWKTVRLGDVFDLQMGKTPDRKNLDFFSTTDNKWISIADISKADKYIFETKEFISDEAVKKSGIKQIPANTVIMSFKLSIGKTAITKGPMYSNEAIMAFLPNGKYEVDNDFLYHLFSNKDWSEGSNKAVKGITLNKASLLEVKILLPPLTIQKQIAKTMDKCTEIISKNKRMLENYDTLIKSRFIEMFGDPVQNPMGWETKSLESVADIVSGITKGRKTKEKELFEVPYMAVSNVKAGYIDWTNVKTIEATKTEIATYQLKINDVLMAEGGDPDKVGRGALLTTVPKNCIHQNHVFRVRLNQLSSIYFSQYLQHEKSKRYFFSCAKQTTGIASINMTQLKELPVLIPSEKKQNDFAAFVHQIDKSKFAVQKSLEKAETLYKSLMQEYFE